MAHADKRCCFGNVSNSRLATPLLPWITTIKPLPHTHYPSFVWAHVLGMHVSKGIFVTTQTTTKITIILATVTATTTTKIFSTNWKTFTQECRKHFKWCRLNDAHHLQLSGAIPCRPSAGCRLSGWYKTFTHPKQEALPGLF